MLKKDKQLAKPLSVIKQQPAVIQFDIQEKNVFLVLLKIKK